MTTPTQPHTCRALRLSANEMGRLISFKPEEIGEVLQRIYDSEINVQISSFWDGGFDFQIGDFLNGIKKADDYTMPEDADITKDYRKIEDAVSYLALCVCRAYPDSTFTEWYKAIKR